jgi:ABC-type Fe3+/spermidine/putrescine transport system ATPase subunit
MAGGRLEQVGTPVEMYDHPATPYVRDFLGRTLSLEGTLAWRGGEAVVQLASDVGDRIGPLGDPDLAGLDGETVRVFVRPEDIEIVPFESGARVANRVRATVVSVEYLGDHFEYKVDVGGSTGILDAPRKRPHAVGDVIGLTFDPSRASVWVQ